MCRLLIYLLDSCRYPKNYFVVQTRSQCYQSPTLEYFEGAWTKDSELVVDTEKAFEPILTLDTISRLWILNVDMFDEMNNDSHHMIL